MKNLLAYYFMILFPIGLMAVLVCEEMKTQFVILAMGYVILYRPTIDGGRLLKKGTIKKNQFWRVFIPMWRMRYFNELYFEK